MGAFEELVAGNFFDSIITPFSSLIGTEMFYLIIWASMLWILFMRTKHWGIVMIAILVTSFAVVPNIPLGAQIFVIIFVIGGMIYMVYDVFKSTGR